MRKAISAGLMFALMSTSASLFAARKPSVPAPIVAQNVFLGQIYPSGNIYLKGFSDELGDRATTAWPPRVFVRGIAKEPSAAAAIFGDFKRALKDWVKGKNQYSLYFPGVEGMDEQHNPCGETPSKHNSAYVYLEKDFFDSVFDHCESNEGVALYTSSHKGTESYRVMAVGTALQVENIRLAGSAEGRPLAPGESDEIATQKRRGASSENDCTTVPAFRDDAVILLTFGFEGTRTSARISSYEDPGCMGHLETIFLLDVMDDGAPQKTYELHQYQGPI